VFIRQLLHPNQGNQNNNTNYYAMFVSVPEFESPQLLHIGVTVTGSGTSQPLPTCFLLPKTVELMFSSTNSKDLQIHILSFLDAKSIASIARTSKHLATLITSEDFWRILCKAHFNADEKSNQSNFNNPMSWREKYKSLSDPGFVQVGSGMEVSNNNKVFLCLAHLFTNFRR
jgi:hypothetical protein